MYHLLVEDSFNFGGIMQRLYLIGGPHGGRKTAVCQELKKRLPQSVFLDGDCCWDADPFQVTEETKKMDKVLTGC